MKTMKNIINYFMIWIVVALVIHFWKIGYYTYAPVSAFIDYQKIELLDHKQWQPIQVLHSIRNSRKTLEWDYLFKTYCKCDDWDWKTNSSWFYHEPAILLEKTKELKTIKVDMDFPYTLPLWECKTVINVKLNINWVIRELENFETYFKVY